MVKNAIRTLVVVEFFVLLSYFISFGFFINLQLAFLSSFFIIIGSMWAYKKMVHAEVEANMLEEKRDFLDELEDPHGLYEEIEINEAPPEELDLRAIVKEEKKRIKLINFKDMKNGSKAGFSLLRLLPYLFLVLGFIALKNNELLDIAVYLPSLLLGIVVAYLSGKEVLLKKS